MSQPSDNFDFQNFYEATLNGDITDTTLVIPLSTVPAPFEGLLVINPDGASPEIIFYDSKGVNDVTCPADGRGFDSTTAQPWSSGTTVIMAPVGYMFRAFKEGLIRYATPMDESTFDFVASGCVWSGDSYGSTRVASMTAGVVYINGQRVPVSAVTSRTFTASKDTYIDVGLDGVLDYTEVSNNAASPALSADHIRIGIVVTGASNIADAGSVNQGQEDKVLPIASSIAYSVTDSLGNLICPRDPARATLGLRQRSTDFTTTSLSVTDITGLSVPFIADGIRKVLVELIIPGFSPSSATAQQLNAAVYEGGTIVAVKEYTSAGANYHGDVNARRILTPTAGLHTYKATAIQTAAGTLTCRATTTYPMQLRVSYA